MSMVLNFPVPHILFSNSVKKFKNTTLALCAFLKLTQSGNTKRETNNVKEAQTTLEKMQICNISIEEENRNTTTSLVAQ